MVSHVEIIWFEMKDEMETVGGSRNKKEKYSKYKEHWAG